MLAGITVPPVPVLVSFILGEDAKPCVTSVVTSALPTASDEEMA